MQHEVSRGRLGTARLMYWSRHYWLDEPAVVAIDGCRREIETIAVATNEDGSVTVYTDGRTFAEDGRPAPRAACWRCRAEQAAGLLRPSASPGGGHRPRTRPGSGRVAVDRAEGEVRPTRSGRHTFGRITVDYGAREVYVDGEPIGLTRVEFDIVDLLSSAPRGGLSARSDRRAHLGRAMVR